MWSRLLAWKKIGPTHVYDLFRSIIQPYHLELVIFSGGPTEECVNFAKRWQQFNILENMRRFKQLHYDHVVKNERILSFFNSFQEFRDEEQLWQISESIKPRGGKKLI